MHMEVTMLKKKRYKRGISFLLVLSLITSVIYVTPGYGKEARAASSWNGYTATSYEAGTGTKDNPYQIKWGSQLAYLAKNVSEGETYEGKYFVVTADIRLNVTDGANDWTTWTADTAGLKEWKSIGTYESADSNKPFAGTFNGEGHTISGIWSCNRGTNGLFGYNTGTVSDINVKDSYIEGSGYGVGAVAGKNEGVIYGCSSNANIVSMWADENNIEAGSAGGIAGTNSGTVNYAVNTGTVNGVGVTGGVVGTNAGKIINSGNEGIVGEDVRSQYGTGGIAGCNSKESSEIQNCCNRGNIYADNYAGGIVGTNVGKAVNTYNDADIDITQNKGIAGAVSGALERSGFDSSGSVSYSYWAMTTNITANGALCDNAAAGYTGQNGKVDSNSCMYNAGGYLVDNTGRKEIEFTISGKTEKKDTLSEALDCWTQSDEGGKGSLEYLRWEKGDDGLPKFCQIRSEVWNGDGSNSFGGGDGSEDAPYRITNGEQLKYLAMQVNSGNSYSGENFVLTTDIYLNDEIFTFVPDTGLVEVTDGVNTAYIGTGITGDGSGGSTQFDTAASRTDICYIYDGSSYVQGTYAGDMNSWTPIGTANRPFAGNINGKGYKIHGIYVRDYACEGLFGYIGGGSVKNLGIYNSCFISSGSKYVGSVTGFISGDITKCVVDDTIICSLATDYTGGIAGYFADSPTNSDGSYKDSGLMFGNEFAGVVYGDGTVGGISGYSGYGNRIDECSTNENALIKGDGSAVGGITGRNYGSTILNTYNTGDVTGGNERTYTGGIAGENMSEGESCIEGYPDVFGIIANCYNRGRVTGYTSSHAGGIVGHNFGGTVENSYCDGTVMGNTAGAAAGGIAGVNNISDGKYTLYEGLTQQQYKRCSGNISYSYAIGTITGSNLCDASCIKESVTFSKSGYTLSQPVLGQSTVCDALNAWVKSPDEGLGNDGEFGTYLKWVYPSKEYPRFDGTHFLETPDNEPLPKYSLIYNPNGDD
ncbi:MAG: hypothetical protein HFH14_09735, partial [Lachnospiraceae bacterium]|nr:hypothetical protein [Lachnospiraceae bacterium]